jgi:Fe-S oxidoreductase
MALKDFDAESDWCSQCSFCKWIPYDQVKSWRFAKNCPSIAYFNFNTYSARGRYAVTRSLLHEQSTITEEVKDVAFTCLACGSCDVSCKVCRYNLEPLDMVRELKFHAVENGAGRDEHRAVIERVEKTGNPMGLPRTDRGNWAEGIEVKRLVPDKAEVLFFAGCQFSYDTPLQGAARTALKVLKAAGLDIAIAGPREMCCGGRWYGSGYRDTFDDMAAANIKAWERAGVKTIVTPCSDCFHAIGRLYKERGANFEVVHTVQLVSKLAAEGKLAFKNSVPMTVTWHDPCHLGRQGEPYVPWQGEYTKILNQVVVHTSKKPRYNGAKGIYDEPRALLRAIPGVQLVEMERIREYSWCCGAGGGVREAYPEYSRWTAAERLEEARATGAEALVTACGWCERNFLDAAATGGSNLPVLDIMDLVAKALE